MHILGACQYSCIMCVFTADIVGRPLMVLHNLGCTLGIFGPTTINYDDDILKTIIKYFCIYIAVLVELSLTLIWDLSDSL